LRPACCDARPVAPGLFELTGPLVGAAQLIVRQGDRIRFARRLLGVGSANVHLPSSLAGKGKVTIQLTANGLAANAVNITIQ
jgi:hypothetical protein